MNPQSSQKVTYLGKVDFRNKELTFGIKEDDRTRHTYVIGKTGMGKSTLLENMIIQDINNGEGVCVIDPHGSLAEKLLDFVPEHRVHDVIYFAPFDSECPIGLNVLEKVAPDKRHLVANGLMAAFKKIWVDAWSARMEYILNNIILALLENEGQTLLGVNRMLTDKEYRKFIVSNVTDPTVRDFWLMEYANYTERFAQDAAPAIQNKVGQFVGNPLIRNILGQTHTSFDLRDIMDNKKILIVNLSKGKVGEGNANLIGALLITKIYLAAMSRADAGPYNLKDLPPFYFYVDEFQNFANESFASILSEARKYKLALTVAHQYIEQMTDEVKAAVFGNVGTMIAFRVGATDAEVFEKEFAPYFILDDIVNLSAYQIYLRLMIDGVGSKPFSARTLAPIPQPVRSYANNVIEYSRKKYGKTKHLVEEEVARFYEPMKKPEVLRKETSPDGVAVHVPRETSSPKKEYDRQDTRDKRTGSDRRYVQSSPSNTSFSNRQRDDRNSERRSDRSSSRQDVPHLSPPSSPRERQVDHKPPQKTETLFDDKPVVSLKDALEKAMREGQRTEDKITDNKPHFALEATRGTRQTTEVAKSDTKQEADNRQQTTDDIKQRGEILGKVEGETNNEQRTTSNEVSEDKLKALIYDEEK